MSKKIILAHIAVICIATIGVGNAAPPDPGPVPVEVLNTTSNPVPVIGNTAVSNFPATQDVSVTNTSSNPVPTTLRKDRGRMTLNTRIFNVPAGGTEVFSPEVNFQPLQASFIAASGLDEEVMVIIGNESANKLILYGNMGSGIGQEDYVFSLPEPIDVSQVEVRCLEASGSCRLFVEVVGRF